jgi:hypothetical protein
MLMDLEPKEELTGAAVYTRSVRIEGSAAAIRNARRCWRFVR